MIWKILNIYILNVSHKHDNNFLIENNFFVPFFILSVTEPWIKFVIERKWKQQRCIIYSFFQLSGWKREALITDICVNPNISSEINASLRWGLQEKMRARVKRRWRCLWVWLYGETQYVYTVLMLIISRTPEIQMHMGTSAVFSAQVTEPWLIIIYILCLWCI